MTDNAIKQHVQSQFGAHAQGYVTSQTHAKGGDLARLIDIAQPDPAWRVLDVATGGGHTALAFAPHVASVVACDLTEAMLHAARDFVAPQAANVTFMAGDAEALPFADGTFDAVTCRIAPHHFPNIAHFFAESYRVLRVGGLLLVEDILLPDSKKAGRYIDAFEKLRDPSHVHARASYEWRTLYEDAGFALEHSETFIKRHQFMDWARRMGCDAITIERLHVLLLRAPAKAAAWLDAEHAGTDAATFCYRYALMRGRKPI